MRRTGPARRWHLGASGAAVVALLAVAALAAWSLTRPAPTAGDGLTALGSVTPSPTVEPSVRARARLATSGASSDPATAAAPARLRIPDLDVDASVRPVGVQDDGSMVIPAAPTSVGWYRFGAAPSDLTGHTVIAGHVATREDGVGALAPLAAAEEGMPVDLVDVDGVVHHYEVIGRESVSKKSLPVDRIFARDGAPLLVLVTCGGEYLPELRAHRDNVVVTAAPVG